MAPASGNQARAGGARGWALVHTGSGRGDRRKRKGTTSAVSSNGIDNAAPGGSAWESACTAQNGQCFRCEECCSAGSAVTTAPSITLISFVPSALQIWVQVSPRDADKAWEMDGASAANSIAKHAIQAATPRVILVIPMPKLYQAPRAIPRLFR